MPRKIALEELVERYPAESGADKKQTLENMLSQDGAERRIYGMVFGDRQRAALRVLADACKKKISKEIIKPSVIADAERLLFIKDDKARKTACILIGLCAPDECAEKLLIALKNEKIRFVRPSIILALGNTAKPGKYLNGYIVEPGEDKHVREESDALKKALAKTAAPSRHARLTLPEECLLTYVHLDALRSELDAKHIRYDVRTEIIATIRVRTRDIASFRCYADALYHLGEKGEYKKAAETLNTIGCRGLLYRIEAGAIGPEERREAIRAVSDGLMLFGYSDNPSAYSFEVRLTRSGSMYAVFPDERFAYRKQSVAASINPVTAASVMRIALPYMKDNASVLDPFCGSATMLIEREYVKKTGSLVGVDISPAAIKAACANRKASGLRMALIKGDILGFGASRYDEIVSNMPFGNRVGGHQSNIRLYREFADKLKLLLNENGVAFLYTQEKKLLRDVIGEKKEFSIVREEAFQSGGLSPTLFIIKRSQP